MKKITLLILALVFFLPLVSQGATLSVESATTEASLHQKFLLQIYLQTEGENINAVEGTVELIGNSIRPEKIVDSNSLISYWLERPSLETMPIRFSGIIPGGYDGKKGLIFSILCSGQAAGLTTAQIVNARLLLSDGQGSALTPQLGLVIVRVNDQVVQSPADNNPFADDHEAPESFKPELGRAPELYNNDWFVAFTTQDKLSGMDYYTIQESRNGYLDPNGWQRADSPYLLRDQSLKSSIYIKAFDLAGNERQVIIAPSYVPQGYDKYLIYIIILVIILLFLVVRFRSKKI